MQIDNKLTDIGLAAVINMLPKCTSLTSLNLSENKIDLVASNAMAEYFRSDGCQLVEIVLNKADIDDNESAKFLKVSYMYISSLISSCIFIVLFLYIILLYKIIGGQTM